jgi:hypothetical protein
MPNMLSSQCHILFLKHITKQIGTFMHQIERTLHVLAATLPPQSTSPIFHINETTNLMTMHWGMKLTMNTAKARTTTTKMCLSRNVCTAIHKPIQALNHIKCVTMLTIPHRSKSLKMLRLTIASSSMLSIASLNAL